MPSIAVTDKPEDLGLSSGRLARIGPFFEQPTWRRGACRGC